MRQKSLGVLPAGGVEKEMEYRSGPKRRQAVHHHFLLIGKAAHPYPNSEYWSSIVLAKSINKSVLTTTSSTLLLLPSVVISIFHRSDSGRDSRPSSFKPPVLATQSSDGLHSRSDEDLT